MSNKISFYNQDDVQKVMSQTNYTEEEAVEKLQLFDGDCIRVIKNYMGIPDKKEQAPVKSVNQEIFRQIRFSLDSSMKTYRDKNPINVDQVIDSFTESDKREAEKREAEKKNKK
jgi:hypothetical protein